MKRCNGNNGIDVREDVLVALILHFVSLYRQLQSVCLSASNLVLLETYMIDSIGILLSLQAKGTKFCVLSSILALQGSLK